MESYLAMAEYSLMNKTSFKDNIVSLKIYYSELKYTEINQVFSFSFWDLVSAVGGNLGLFLGVSLLSILELVQVLFLVVSMTFGRKKISAENLN